MFLPDVIGRHFSTRRINTIQQDGRGIKSCLLLLSGLGALLPDSPV